MANEITRVYRDALLQQKKEDGSVDVIFPVTRYDAVIGSPKVLSEMSEANNVPFVLHIPSFEANGY